MTVNSDSTLSLFGQTTITELQSTVHQSPKSGLHVTVSLITAVGDFSASTVERQCDRLLLSSFSGDYEGILLYTAAIEESRKL